MSTEIEQIQLNYQATADALKVLLAHPNYNPLPEMTHEFTALIVNLEQASTELTAISPAFTKEYDSRSVAYVGMRIVGLVQEFIDRDPYEPIKDIYHVNLIQARAIRLRLALNRLRALAT